LQDVGEISREFQARLSSSDWNGEDHGFSLIAQVVGRWKAQESTVRKPERQF
jgi:hypothetical protein